MTDVIFGPSRIDNLFDSLWNFKSSRIINNTSFKNVDGNLLFTIELPGYSKEDVSVKYQDGSIVIEWQKEGDKEKNFYKFSHDNKYDVPFSCEMKHGVLSILFHKVEEESYDIEVL